MDERVVKTSKSAVCNVIMENRSKVSASGVIDVASFDDETVILETELGTLIIKGQDFHINKLNVDIGELIIEGEVDSCVYGEGYSKQKGGGLFSRMFK